MYGIYSSERYIKFIIIIIIIIITTIDADIGSTCSIYKVIHYAIWICFDMHISTMCARIRLGSKGYTVCNSNCIH